LGSRMVLHLPLSFSFQFNFSSQNLECEKFSVRQSKKKFKETVI
jgi:hypothetical protein